MRTLEGVFYCRELRLLVIQREHDVLDVFELGVVLPVGVAEELDLRLRKLAHAKEASLGRNFVTERLTDLRHAKGELAALIVQQVPEVDEDALWCKTRDWEKRRAHGISLSHYETNWGEGGFEGVRVPGPSRGA